MRHVLQLISHWNGLPERHRFWIFGLTSIIGISLLWWLCIAPALLVSRSAPSAHHDLDSLLLKMRALQAQARALASQKIISPEQVLRSFEVVTKTGLNATAQWNVAGERITVTLKGASADDLIQWLIQVRSNAQITPDEARLVRSARSSAVGASDLALWDGVLVFNLPAH